MNLKVLQFQNKKLGERLEELKAEEETLKEQVDELKKQRRSDLDLISIINRHWMQVLIGSIYVSGKLRTYPTPDLTLALFALGKMVSLGRGRWAVSQQLILQHQKLKGCY